MAKIASNTKSQGLARELQLLPFRSALPAGTAPLKLPLPELELELLNVAPKITGVIGKGVSEVVGVECVRRRMLEVGVDVARPAYLDRPAVDLPARPIEGLLQGGVLRVVFRHAPQRRRRSQGGDEREQ
ncbi:RNI-like superfamily protein [Striga asiatica]|uniref:RNI-like superfamily protein n=1 Tax=Striga asiatica TaxID=4170 RepID=A0A5A7Q6P7_STRAF|nr:RNI-like superfamily protein [Striga asiatica]